ILKRHGNMSSPSVVFALQQAMRSGRPEKDRDWWLVSFGAEGDVPVARAEAVGASPVRSGEESIAAAGSEVRPAEPVGIKESLETESPGVVVPEPQPIQF
ncbi:MAG: hypothetical protein ACKOEI_03525, partial [Chthoniobacterales bacterium]